MKLALRRRSKKERAIDVTSDLAKLWVAAKLTKATAPGRKAPKLKALTGSKTGRRAAAGKALTGSKTGRGAGRKVLGAALAGKAAKGTAQRRRGEGRGPKRRGRKLLVLGGAAGAVALALKARKSESEDQASTWTPPDAPVGGATIAGDFTTPSVPPGPTNVTPSGAAPADATSGFTMGEDPPNVGATGLAPEATDEQADRS